VDTLTYDTTIEILNKAINRSAIDRSEKVKAFQRPANFAGPAELAPDATSRRPTLSTTVRT
jgi:hypothetical protein